ncbi:TniQ family protein [Micrococcus porci]|uniref:TniQ family protein n=1 Tax=Micrococcus porci TaxID=2856555 RepID=UPI003CEA0903
MSRPVQIPPMPGESLTGYLQRYQQAGLAPVRLTVPASFDNASAPAAVITQVHAATGLSEDQITGMTMHRWVPSIRGYRVQRRHGWKLHPHRWWICPQCTVRTGYQSLRWRLALQPVCLRCRTYLVDPDNAQIPQPVPEATVELVQGLDRILDDALSGRRSARQRLSTLRQACQHLAQQQDAPTPVALDPALTSWGAYPCADPVKVAHLLTLASATITRVTAPNRPDSRAMDPAAPGQSASGATVTSLSRARLRATVTTLTDWSQSTGLCARHVPTIAQPSLHTGGGRPSLVAQAGTALALHLLLDEATGVPASAAAARSAHGLTGEPLDHRLLHRVITRDGLDDDQQHHVLQAAEELIAGGLVEYQLRRAVFRTQPHLPRLLVPDHWIPAVEEFSATTMTRAWIWLHVAGGHPQLGPVPSVRLDEIDDFNHHLDPETRLHLYEAAAAQIDGPDLVGLLTGSATGHERTRQVSPRRYAG